MPFGSEVEPEENEVIPTALENKKIFKPFEFIVNLYGVPKYFEIDPTPYMSLFFALFFVLELRSFVEKPGEMEYLTI